MKCNTAPPPSSANPLGVLIAVGLSMAAADGVHAQSSPESAQTLPSVTVQGTVERALDLSAPSQTGSRLGLSLRETPASVEVITQDTMQLRGARTLEEALRGAVGLSVGGHPGNPGIASTRGFTGGFITYLFDGDRVSTPAMSSFKSVSTG